MTVTTAAAPATAAAPEAGTAPTADRSAMIVRHLLLALLAYVPLLFNARDRAVADTKTYLYLDPGRLLQRAPYLWDPNVGLGTVTHQNIGYLFPMGPWFWIFDRLGVPDWVAQRLWVGTLMFAAAAGMLFLQGSLGWRTQPPVDEGSTEAESARGRTGWLVRVAAGGGLAAATLYMLSPYVLENAARFSVLLMPWSALPWLLGLTQRALRSGSWRHPALFAITVTIVGGVNATALILAGIGPLLWVPFAVWAHHEVTLRRALATVARIGVLSLGCSLWWMAGLSVQGGYGIDVLRYSETVQAVARTSLSSEVLRGLGYWFFYGGDKVGPWIEPSHGYIQHLWLIAAGFAVPGLALVAAVSTRWRYRAFFVAMVAIGTAVAVGAFPYDAPSPVGGLFKAFATSSTAGLAMRSTPRAVPLVVLGLAMLVAAGVAGLARHLPKAAAGATVAVVLLAGIGLPALWTGRFFGKNLQRPEQVPQYWKQAAAYLDQQGRATRVLEIPGSDFASYRWGTTIDPITPGLMDRPYAARELIPYGSAPSADLMLALDRPLQDGLFDPAVLAPVARLMNVGDVVLRSDLEYERFRLPRPKALWDKLTPAPPGLDAPATFGAPTPNRALERLPLRDPIELAIPAGTPDPPPVAVFPVKKPVPIVRAAPASRPLLVAGDGEGVVEAAAARLLGGDAPLFYSAALANEPTLRKRLLASGAELVLTDTNRKRGRRWSNSFENTGYTETASERPLVNDLSDNRLPLFPDAGVRAFSTVEQRGVKLVTATHYGNPATYIPEVRPTNALDGDLETSWRVGDFSPVRDERLVIALQEPVTTDRLNVVQPLDGARNRFITQLGIRVDGRDIGTFPLDESSRQPQGQQVTIGRHRFSKLELIVRGDNIGSLRRYDGISPVGFAEVRLPGVHVDEVVRLPSDLLAAAGRGSADHDLSILLSRERSNPVDLGRLDEEQSMVRAFSLPTARRFSITGDARISAYLPEPEIDRLLGIPTADQGGVSARSSNYLRGILGTRASNAIDGDPKTAWNSEFGDPAMLGSSIDVDVPKPVTVDHLDLAFVTDGDHSVPTRLRIEGSGQTRTVDIPPLSDRRQPAATTSVTVRFPPLRASHLRVVIEDIRRVQNNDYYSEKPVSRPVGVAELGIPGVRRLAPRPKVDSGCRDDLVQVDGRPLGLRISGPEDAAANRSALRIELCGRDAGGMDLGAGDHLVRAVPGKKVGIDLDRLVLSSPAPRSTAAASQAGLAAAPNLKVVHDRRTSLDVRVSGAKGPFWLVLGQSNNKGWAATVSGVGSLGEPKLVDGFANGWYVDPHGRQDLQIKLVWQPQRGVWLGLALSTVCFLLCLAIAVWGWRRRPADAALTRPSPGTGPALAELASPFAFDATRGRLGPVRAAVLAVVCGVGAALVVSPLVGALVLGAVALALGLGRRGRSVLTVGAVVAFGLAGAFTVARQAWKGGPPGDFTWVTYFSFAHIAAWTAVVLLAADVVVAGALARSASATKAASSAAEASRAAPS